MWMRHFLYALSNHEENHFSSNSNYRTAIVIFLTLSRAAKQTNILFPEKWKHSVHLLTACCSVIFMLTHYLL
jgi:hypothetical protein